MEKDIPILTGIKQSEADKEMLINYAKNPCGFLLLSGKNGTGKSYAAKAIYNHISPFRLPAFDHEIAIFINQADLNFEWQQSRDEINFLVNKYKKTKLLVLDDIGTRTPTEAFMDFIYAIIDYRYCQNHELGTIITTNLNSDDMRDKFGDAFVSRVASEIVKRWEHEDRRVKEF